MDQSANPFHRPKHCSAGLVRIGAFPALSLVMLGSEDKARVSLGKISPCDLEECRLPKHRQYVGALLTKAVKKNEERVGAAGAIQRTCIFPFIGKPWHV